MGQQQEIPDEERFVTRREQGLELKSFRNEMRLLIAVTWATTNLDIPRELTAAAIIAVVAKVGLGVIAR